MSTPPTSDETIFAAALVRPRAERAAFLDGACAGDEARRARIADLLRAHEEAEQDFMRTAASASPRVADLSAIGLATAEPVAGDRIGRYKLLQKIGEGGCGIVYVPAAPAGNRGLVTNAVEQPVQFYTEWGKPEQTALWQKKLDELNAGQKSPPPAKS